MLAAFYEFYIRIYQPNIFHLSNENNKEIFIPSEASFDNVIDILTSQELLIDVNSFIWLAKQKNYDDNVKSGRYVIGKDLNNNDLINLLRSGRQSPINVTFNNVRTKEQLASKIASQIEADSTSIISYITDIDFLRRLNMNIDNIGCLFIPNTYEFYWNTSAEEFAKRMIKEYQDFWNLDRQKKAMKLKLDYYQISILASIVEKEQNIKTDERPYIAGLYLNRLRKKMKLESDPTLIYAIGDFSINRVLNKDKRVKSPYNTYKHKGLPPGPICIPSINSIDAVLNAVDHDFIFMCAKEDFSGYHNFSKTYTQHLRYARKYQKALNKRRIMR